MTTDTDRGLENQIVRYRLNQTSLDDRTVIFEGIPGAQIHDGGKIAFGPDGLLYITTGDAGNENLSQNLNSLAGKVLRITDDGEIPDDNPFGDAIYSYGHRNAQGLIWDNEGRLWSTEHGRSGRLSGLDELNTIVAGGNYGWPIIEGDETRSNMITPVIHSGADETWAPGGIAYADNSLFFSGLRGSRLYQATINQDGGIAELKTHFIQEYGRLRAATVAGDYLYISTSNTDGRGNPADNDDRIIKIPLSIFD